MTWFDAVWFDVVWYDRMWHTIMWYDLNVELNNKCIKCPHISYSIQILDHSKNGSHPAVNDYLRNSTSYTNQNI